MLWQRRRNRNLGGFKFRRQVALGNYIVDFACMEQRPIIELDGRQHLEAEAQDRIRTLYLQRGGFNVLRFWNDQILRERDAVLDVILHSLTSPHPNLLPLAGEGAEA